jgi:hypothetical protein
MSDISDDENSTNGNDASAQSSSSQSIIIMKEEASSTSLAGLTFSLNDFNFDVDKIEDLDVMEKVLDDIVNDRPSDDGNPQCFVESYLKRLPALSGNATLSISNEVNACLKGLHTKELITDECFPELLGKCRCRQGQARLRRNHGQSKSRRPPIRGARSR